MNLGPVGIATRTLYENWDSGHRQSLRALATRGRARSTAPTCLTAGASRVPLAQNIVLMKVQYGLDTVQSRSTAAVDCWTPANANICGAAGCDPGDGAGDWGTDRRVR